MHKLKSSPQDYNARILWHFLVDAEQQTSGLYINKSTVHVPLAFSQTHYIIFESGNMKYFKRQGVRDCQEALMGIKGKAPEF